MSNKAITGLFSEPTAASAAVNDLLSRGVEPKTISVVASENSAKETFAIEPNTKIGEGAAIGGGLGGGVGAIVAGLTTVGAVASSGVGLVAAGPLVAALAGAGAGAAGGGVIGGLIGSAIPEHEVKFFESALAEGAVLVGVDAKENDPSTVKEVFDNHAASKISTA